MNRFDYLQRRINGGYKRSRGNFRKRLNIVMLSSVTVAVILVIVLLVAKIYSGLNSGNRRDGKEPLAQEVSVTPVPAVETPPVVTPRPMAVALTFDDGPSRENTPKILEVLQARGAHATFFVLGDRARVDGDIMQMQLAAGCELASHSWNHPQLSKMKWKKVKKQLTKTNDIVEKLTNGYQISLLRPPYGAISRKMRKKLKMPMILWSLDTLDWKSRNPKKILKNVQKNVKDGDIILMHDIYPTTAEAVGQVVPWLQEQGYDVMSVSELMARNGKKLENGKAYLDGRLDG